MLNPHLKNSIRREEQCDNSIYGTNISHEKDLLLAMIIS